MGSQVFRQFLGICGLIALAACGGSSSSTTAPSGSSGNGSTGATLSTADESDIASLMSNAYQKWASGIGTALAQTGGTGSVSLSNQTVACSGGGTTIIGGSFTNTLSSGTGNGSLAFNVTTT